MNGKDLLTGLGYIDTRYYEEAETAQAAETPKPKLFSRPMVIAALIGLMVLLMGCAWVVLGLQNLLIPENNSDIPKETDLYGGEINRISLQGYMGSDCYEAAREWQAFLESYDSDDTIPDANDDFRCPEAYESYRCYSQEMIDKVDEICEKYDLTPLGKAQYFDGAQDLFTAIGIGTAFAESVRADAPYSYCYGDGTFHMEGRAELPEPRDEIVGFQYRSVQKTAFDGVSLGIGSVDEYNQWNYTMKDGTEVLLAQREEGSLIIADMEDHFVTVNVLGVFSNGGYFGDIPGERAFLEAVCELFDFSYQTHPLDSDRIEEFHQAQHEEQQPQDSTFVGGQVDPAHRDSYAVFLQYMVEEMEFRDLKYVLIDVDGNGVEELLLQCQHIGGYNGDQNSFFDLLTIHEGEVKRLHNSSNLYLCEGGVIEYGDRNYRCYSTLSEGREAVVYFETENKWCIQEDWTNAMPYIEVNEAEANAVIAKYPRVELDFKPIEEFSESST